MNKWFILGIMKLSFYLQKSSGIKEVHHDLEEKKYSEDEGNHGGAGHCGCKSNETEEGGEAGIAGVSMLAGALLVVTTKKIFDEIFLEDDWSDVDWGEEDDDYIID